MVWRKADCFAFEQNARTEKRRRGGGLLAVLGAVVSVLLVVLAVQMILVALRILRIVPVI